MSVGKEILLEGDGDDTSPIGDHSALMSMRILWSRHYSKRVNRLCSVLEGMPFPGYEIMLGRINKGIGLYCTF